jgi:SAM-dependent MidA family methyltransferase
MTADPDERRDTLLARRLVAEIKATGPISVNRYMERCLGDPEHGYYRSRSGIGRDGDFTTAPEISQVFGELIGLWSAVVWQQMGAPERVNLVELGPGRGVLMADALRAASIMPGFLAAIDLHLVEINPAFREMQSQRLAKGTRAPTWHNKWPELAAHPTIVIANEFLDTVPASQWQRGADGDWLELCVGAGAEGNLQFVRRAVAPPPVARALPQADEDTTFTHSDFSDLAGHLAAQSNRAPLAALLLDYGHTKTAWGDTLQAVRNHAFEHPLTSPGEADLSVAVDFEEFARATKGDQLSIDGPLTQAEFLGRLGISERASRLMAANPGRAHDIESGVFRIMSETGMGTRFQAIAVRSPQLAALPGFE